MLVLSSASLLIGPPAMLRSDDTEVDCSEVASVDPTEAS